MERQFNNVMLMCGQKQNCAGVEAHLWIYWKILYFQTRIQTTKTESCSWCPSYGQVRFRIQEFMNTVSFQILNISNSMKKKSSLDKCFCLFVCLFSVSVFYSLFSANDTLDQFSLVIHRNLEVFPEFRGSLIVIPV